MKTLLTSLVSLFLLFGCSDGTPAAKTENTASQKAEFIPTIKYSNTREMFNDKNNYPEDDGSFKLIKQNPIEFIIRPEITANENTDTILDAYKYAALEGLLLTFAHTNANNIVFHVHPRIRNGENPQSKASSEAIKMRITLKASRTDLTEELKKQQIYSIDDLIDHGEQPYAIPGKSNSKIYSNLRNNDAASWEIINHFRTDKYKF